MRALIDFSSIATFRAYLATHKPAGIAGYHYLTQSLFACTRALIILGNHTLPSSRRAMSLPRLWLSYLVDFIIRL